jgi:ArsR family transcriptional regulator
MIYSLPQSRSPMLDANLACLQDCVQNHAVFKNDRRRLEKMRAKLCWLEEVCGGGESSAQTS